MSDSRRPLHKLRRLLKLLECLQSGHDFNAKDLAELCGVTRRQIFRDLAGLQDSGVPVVFDAARRSYRVAHPTFLPATELTLQESLALLVLASQLGDPAHGVPLHEAARDAAVKLSSNLPAHVRNEAGALLDVVRVRAEPTADLAPARATLAQVQAAFRQRRRLRISYHSLFEQQVIRTLVSPYRLLFRRHAWYVIGRSSVHRAVRMFHLGRIQTCELTTDRYEIPARFSLEKHLGNAWQFVREPGPDVVVRIRFQPKVATNVAEVLWHKTQVSTWNADGTLDFEVTVSGVQEISWWVLGYGGQAEVLAPPALRELVAGHAEKMLRQYRHAGAERVRLDRRRIELLRVSAVQPDLS